MELPLDFISRMKAQLADDYDDYLKSYNDQNLFSLRVNNLKVSNDKFTELNNLMNFKLDKISWENSGFYYSLNDKPGKSIFHNLGLYYIQEASAMVPVNMMDIQENDLVLDICASPGGKSTQIADKLKGSGLLVSNEIVGQRALILSSNIERMGIPNCIVTNDKPESFAKIGGVFDKVLVDAPCSGEGMFRKDPETIKEWSIEHVKSCSIRQRKILEDAAKAVKPGGVLVYSTCTFSDDENIDTINYFLESHPEFSPDEIRIESLGYDWKFNIYPHRNKGEGHFCARLVKSSDSEQTYLKQKKIKPLKSVMAEDFLKPIRELNNLELFYFKNSIYLLNSEYYYLADYLNIIRLGQLAGEFDKRVIPAHALAVSVLKNNYTKYELNYNSDEMIKYLRGETLKIIDNPSGWIIVTVNGFPLTWGKNSSGILKNHLPKGLRIN